MRRLPLPPQPRLLPLLPLLGCIWPSSVYGTQRTLRTDRTAHRNVHISSGGFSGTGDRGQGLEPALLKGRLEIQRLLSTPGHDDDAALEHTTESSYFQFVHTMRNASAAFASRAPAAIQFDSLRAPTHFVEGRAPPLQPRLMQAEDLMWDEIRAVQNNQRSLAQLQVYQESLDAQQAVMEAEQRQMISQIPAIPILGPTGILGDSWMAIFCMWVAISIVVVICLDVYGVIRHPGQAPKHQRDEFIMPHLKELDEENYLPLCAMVLCSGGDKDWNGMCTLTVEEQQQLLRDIEAESSSGIFGGGNAALSVDEIISFIQNPVNVEKVKRLPACVHGILNEELVREIVNRFDADGSGQLEGEEWNNFIDQIEGHHMDFLLEEAFQSFRAYYGRGQPWQKPALAGSLKPRQLLRYNLKQAAGIPVNLLDVATYDDLRQTAPLALQVPNKDQCNYLQLGKDPDVQKGRLVPAGWAEDFWFYSANVHPLHGMFACDAQHPFSKSERSMIEMAVLLLMCNAYLIKMLVDAGTPPLGLTILEHPQVFKIGVVTFPSLFWWWSLFLLFTCPCVRVDKSVATLQQIERADFKNTMSQGFGYTIVLAAIVGFGFMIFKGIMPAEFLLTVAWSRVQAYFISWALMIGLTFNPIVAWGNPDPDNPHWLGWLGDNIGVGQWRIEKQKFRAICLKVLRKNYEEEDEEAISYKLRTGILSMLNGGSQKGSAS